MKEWKDVEVLFAENKTPEEICKIRTQYSMEWYIRKAIANKRLYYSLSFIGMFCPLLNVVIAAVYESKMGIVILSSVTSLAASLLAITNAKSKWENYRTAAEFLRREYTLFQARAGVYKGEERVSEYLKATEEFMGEVHANWQKCFQEEREGKETEQ